MTNFPSIDLLMRSRVLPLTNEVTQSRYGLDDMA